MVKTLIGSTDCCSTLLRIHLSGHHVLSLLLLGLGSGTGPHLDRGTSCVCAVYVTYRLV